MQKLILLILSLILAAPLVAQNTTGRIIGTVSAADGAVPGAVVVVTDNQTKRERTVTATGDGTFEVPQLEFGTYTVTITAPGFKTFSAADVKIDAGREYPLKAQLEVGQVTEEVTVTAGAEQINASNAELSTTVTEQQIKELPLNGRNPLSLAYLQAGSNVTTNSINGQRASSTTITRDGLNIQDAYIRTGPLGNTSASLEFEILGQNSLTARFVPSQWAGVAPMTVCFTDRSLSGSQITSWEWDLNGISNDGPLGDGYETTGEGPHCYTYPNPGMTVQVRLRVNNGVSVPRTATNTIRTYTPLEASQNFSIVPQGGMAFCFYPDLVNSTLTGWTFGDGNVTGADDPACHTYSLSDTYLVGMCFTSIPGDTPGCIYRPVSVTGSNPTPAVLTGSGSCTAAGVATFTLTNTGAPCRLRIRVRIRRLPIRGADRPLQLTGGGSAIFTVSGYYGVLTLETTDLFVHDVRRCCVESRHVDMRGNWLPRSRSARVRSARPPRHSLIRSLTAPARRSRRAIGRCR